MSWQELKREWEQRPEYLEALEREFPYRDISASVLELRAERGLTQGELAELAHTTQSVISRMESGKHSFEIALLGRIANAVGATWHPVFEFAGEATVLAIAGLAGHQGLSYRIERVDAGEAPLTVYTTFEVATPSFEPVTSLTAAGPQGNRKALTA